MGGTSHTQSTTQQHSKQEPWEPFVPVGEGILRGVQGVSPNLNQLEQGAVGQMTANAQGFPNWAPQAENMAGKFLTGDPTGLINPALNSYRTNMDPIAGMDLDPTKTPGMQNVLDTIRGDINDTVGQQFAGAGRDLSGLHMQTLGRGMSQGLAQPLLNQYNQNVQARQNANNGLFGSALGASSDMTKNIGNAFNLAESIPGLANMGPQGILEAQGLLRNIPLDVLARQANISVPIGGLGGEVNTTGSMQGTNTMSGAQQFAAIASGLGSLFGRAAPTRNF